MAKNLFSMTRTGRGDFKRQIGKRRTEEGEYVWHSFLLGKDQGQAAIRSLLLGRVWDAVHDKWYRDSSPDRSPCPVWDEATLPIGKAVAKGETTVTVTHPLSTQFNLLNWGEKADTQVAVWLKSLRNQFPFLKIELANEELADKIAFGLDRQEEEATAKVEQVRSIKGKTTGQTIEQALNAYKAFLETEQYKLPDGTITDNGIVQLKKVEILKEHLEAQGKLQTTLPQVGNTFLSTWVNYWANRPQSKRGSPMSSAYAKNVIKMIRSFVRWLNANDTFQWDKPKAYEVTPVRIKETTQEIGKEPAIQKYSRAQLATLWEIALPSERVFMILALNCGFGQRELATLRLSEINLETGLIKRRRVKTKVFGKWRLWSETVAAIKWYLAKIRPQSDSPYLFVDKAGKDLLRRTKSGHRNTVIVRNWERLYNRVLKDEPTFPNLSFNKLRKTGANWIRHKYSDELAEMFLAHGKAEMVDHYTNKPYKRLFKALRHYRHFLRTAFEKVADPFPEQTTKGNRSLSLATIKMIDKLRAEKYTLKGIAQKLGISVDTVQRYKSKKGE